MALLIANTTTQLIANGGSPTPDNRINNEHYNDTSQDMSPFDGSTPNGLGVFFNNVTLISCGISFDDGGLYSY